MTWKEIGKRIFGDTPESVDGEWQWGDLFNPASLVNGLFGQDRTESTTNGEFDWSDLFHYRGVADWAKAKLGMNEVDPRKPVVDTVIEAMPEGGVEEPKQEVQDTTDQNIEVGINGTGGATQSIFDFIEQQQQKQWEREDLIRAETQQREDTAYQRAVADMQAAGINPNLMNVSPASSGGGITSATGKNYTPWETVMKEQLTLLQQEIENNFKGDENAKDRLMDLIGKIANLYMLGGIMKGKGGK